MRPEPATVYAGWRYNRCKRAMRCKCWRKMNDHSSFVCRVSCMLFQIDERFAEAIEEMINCSKTSNTYRITLLSPRRTIIRHYAKTLMARKTCKRWRNRLTRLNRPHVVRWTENPIINVEDFCMCLTCRMWRVCASVFVEDIPGDATIVIKYASQSTEFLFVEGFRLTSSLYRSFLHHIDVMQLRNRWIDVVHSMIESSPWRIDWHLSKFSLVLIGLLNFW